MEQGRHLGDRPWAWENFRNGFTAGYLQAMEEHNVVEIVEGLEQLLNEAISIEENDSIYFNTDLDKIKEKLKQAKAEWQQ